MPNDRFPILNRQELLLYYIKTILSYVASVPNTYYNKVNF